MDYLDLTHNMILAHPELFDINGGFVFFIKQAGILLNNVDELLYAIQDVNTTNHIFTWARFMQLKLNGKAPSYIFESPFTILNQIYSEWDRSEYDKCKPIMYNNRGECIHDIIPYALYLFTYYHHCYPCQFARSKSDTNTKIINKFVSDYFKKYYDKLAENRMIITSTTTYEDIYNTIDRSTLRNMYSAMFTPMKITDMYRDLCNTVCKTKYDLSISQQQSLTQVELEPIFNGYVLTSIRVLKEYSYISKIIPNIDYNIIDYNVLNTWVSYIVGLAHEQYNIACDENMNLCLCAINDNLLKSTTATIPSTLYKISTKYHKLSSTYVQPFIGAGIVNLLFTGYFKAYAAKYIHDHMDIFWNVDDPDISFSDDIYNIAVLSRYNLELTAAKKNVFDKMTNMDDIKNMYNALVINGYDQCNAAVVAPYIINMQYKYFNDVNPYINAFTHPIDEKELNYIINIVRGYMMISSNKYIELVNEAIDQFNVILSLNPDIVIPYIKSLNNSCADICILGGITCYNKCLNDNPIIRSYHFKKHVMGITEHDYLVYKHALLITDPSNIKLLNNTPSIDIYKSIMGQAIQEARVLPYMLNNMNKVMLDTPLNYIESFVNIFIPQPVMNDDLDIYSRNVKLTHKLSVSEIKQGFYVRDNTLVSRVDGASNNILIMINDSANIGNYLSDIIFDESDKKIIIIAPTPFGNKDAEYLFYICI